LSSKILKPSLLVLHLLLVLVMGTAVLAQTSADFNLEWHVIGTGTGANVYVPALLKN
jgi:hypothetical protein